MRCGPPARRSRVGRTAPGTTAARSCTASPRCWKTGPAPSSTALTAGGSSGREARTEVAASIDRLVWYAGWCDKFAQTYGNLNPVAGPFFNLSAPEPVGVVGVVAPEEPALLGLVSRVAPALVPGNALVVLASESQPLPAVAFTEVLATSDVPGGVVNLLTGPKSELLPCSARTWTSRRSTSPVPTTRRWGPWRNWRRRTSSESSGSTGTPDWLSPRAQHPPPHRRPDRDQDGVAPEEVYRRQTADEADVHHGVSTPLPGGLA